jgi:hypothetical protein
MSRDGLGTSAFKRDQCLNEREFRCGWSWMMYSGLQRRETFELVATSGEFVGGTLEPHGDLLQWEPTGQGSPHDAVKKQQCTGLLCEQHHIARFEQPVQAVGPHLAAMHMVERAFVVRVCLKI